MTFDFYWLIRKSVVKLLNQQAKGSFTIAWAQKRMMRLEKSGWIRVYTPIRVPRLPHLRLPPHPWILLLQIRCGIGTVDFIPEFQVVNLPLLIREQRRLLIVCYKCHKEGHLADNYGETFNHSKQYQKLQVTEHLVLWGIETPWGMKCIRKNSKSQLETNSVIQAPRMIRHLFLKPR